MKNLRNPFTSVADMFVCEENTLIHISSTIVQLMQVQLVRKYAHSKQPIKSLPMLRARRVCGVPNHATQPWSYAIITTISKTNFYLRCGSNKDNKLEEFEGWN